MAKRIALEQLKIASPCRASWEAMIGDDRTRFCNQCNKNVYNISGMSRDEAETLITNAEGKLCVRMFKRNDGTVLTSDCSVGAHSIRKRAWRVAGSAITATLSLFAGINAQANPRIEQNFTDRHIYVVSRTVNADKKDGKLKITGRINNSFGDIIAGALITLINEQTGKEYQTVVNAKGNYSIDNLDIAFYTIKVSANRFTPFILNHLKLDASEEIIFNVSLDAGSRSNGTVVDGIDESDIPENSTNSNSVPLLNQTKQSINNSPLEKSERLIRGTVTDETGALCVGAQIIIKNQSTGEEFTTTTNYDGIYQLPLAPAIYTIRVDYNGFKESVAKDLSLITNQWLIVDVALQVAVMGGPEADYNYNVGQQKTCNKPAKSAKNSKQKK